MVDEIDLIAGTVKGLALATGEQITKLVESFWRRETAFIQDPRTAKEFRQMKKTPEWLLLYPHIRDTELKKLFRLGIYLRSIEHDQERTIELRNDILNRHKKGGLHIAQAVQNGIVYKLLLEHESLDDFRESEMTSYIENLLHRVSDFVFFIASGDKPAVKARVLLNKMDVHSYPVYVLCGAFGGVDKVNSIVDLVEDELDGYEIEKHIMNFKTTVFFVRPSQQEI